MFHRIKAAWKFLTGKYPVNKTQSVYVHDGGPENRFVQLLAWRDMVLALDAEGKIWELRPQDGYHPSGCYFVNQLVQESPRSY
jgi:hypothetical protein